jgi:hypothetical protein
LAPVLSNPDDSANTLGKVHIFIGTIWAEARASAEKLIKNRISFFMIQYIKKIMKLDS